MCAAIRLCRRPAVAPGRIILHLDVDSLSIRIEDASNVLINVQRRDYANTAGCNKMLCEMQAHRLRYSMASALKSHERISQ